MEKSIQIILMMKNTVNNTMEYIMLQFKIALFYANIYIYIYSKIFIL